MLSSYFMLLLFALHSHSHPLPVHSKQKKHRGGRLHITLLVSKEKAGQGCIQSSTLYIPSSKEVHAQVVKATFVGIQTRGVQGVIGAPGMLCDVMMSHLVTS